jgi:hypothetical protein
MRIRPAALSVALLLAACSTAPSSRSSRPSPSEPAAPLPTAGELYLVSYLDDEGPSFGVRVEAVGPTGRVRPIATVDDLRPAGWDNAAPVDGFGPTVGPTGYLVVGVERNGGFEASDMRTLLVDVTGAGRPTLEIEGALSRPGWGPDGSLFAPGNGPVVVDAVTGRKTAIHLPIEIEPLAAWVADGAGWVATRTRGEEREVGRVSADGTFTPGTTESFQITGMERFIGAEGGTLSMAVSDGATQSDTAIIEFRPEFEPPCQCKVWARFIEPGADPHFGDAVWDANGRGLWLPFNDGPRHWLSHFAKPLTETKVADLPPNVASRIVGISPDDRWVVLGSDQIEPGPLVLVDTAAGESRILAQPDASGAAPTFGGWVR